MQPCVDFLITEECNYRCEYCSQAKGFNKEYKKASDKTIGAFLSFIKTLDKDFLITISGGEPLVHPRLLDVLKAIKEADLGVALVSNFSFPLEKYLKISDILGENLKELFVSFHSSQVGNVDSFLEKAEAFNIQKPRNTKFSVGAVLTDKNVLKIKQVAETLFELNIEFTPQHLRLGNRFVDYEQEAKDFLKQHQKNEPLKALKTFGKACCAGVKFLLVYPDGNAYRCYSSRFNKAHCMGNISDKNFSLFKKTLPCLNAKCTCSKPLEYGMLDVHSKMPLKSAVLGIYNALFLPFLVFKNADNLGAKFKQIFAFKK